MITYLDLDSKVLFLVYVIKKAAFFKNHVEFKTVYLVYHSYMIIIPLLYVLMQRKLLSTYEIDSETTSHGVESNKIPQDDQTKDRAQLG